MRQMSCHLPDEDEYVTNGPCLATRYSMYYTTSESPRATARARRLSGAHWPQVHFGLPQVVDVLMR
jgi:hypothetical protein